MSWVKETYDSNERVFLLLPQTLVMYRKEGLSEEPSQEQFCASNVVRTSVPLCTIVCNVDVRRKRKESLTFHYYKLTSISVHCC